MSTDSQTSKEAADLIAEGYNAYIHEFLEITRRAATRFENRDWKGSKKDNKARLQIYPRKVKETVQNLRPVLDKSWSDKEIWALIKRAFGDRARGHQDIELAETFYNSVARKVFLKQQADSKIQFVGSRYERFSAEPLEPIYQSFWSAKSVADLLSKIVKSHFDDTLFRSLSNDVSIAETMVNNQIGESAINVVEVLRPVFYRNKGAYIFGRIMCNDGAVRPIALALLHGKEGIYIDAILIDQRSVENIFGFTRSYFHVDSLTPNRIIQFIQMALPRHKSSELYISLGFERHGKTELFRDLKYHLTLNDPLIEAPGIEGMVMMVFTMANFDYVFKLIKDEFAEPKTVTHEIVKERYQYIFLHDRVGRLMDTQEFNFVKFPKDLFDPPLLEELLEKTGNVVSVQGDDVLVKHLYIERKVIPLNIYVKEYPEEDVMEVAYDYGQAMKDLAAANLFPGDIFLKNFGVTKNRRVVLYDYDEVCNVTDCKFEKLPEGHEYGSEIVVDPDTVFPSELKVYLGLKQPYRSHFEKHHNDIFTSEFWNDRKTEIAAGHWVDFYPYGDASRIKDEKEGG